MARNFSLRERLERRTSIYVEGPYNCHVWTGSKTTDGYGQLQIGSNNNRKVLYVHRAAYELVHGPIPPNYHVDHICWNKLCMDVDHMRLLSREEHGRISGATHGNYTHCRSGLHLLTQDNIIPYYGKRKCKACLESKND